MLKTNYIIIEGVIGAGKTTLSKMIAEKLNARLILEQFEENPFLGKFYQDQQGYAFQTQMFFLVNRFKQQQGLLQEELFSEQTVSDYLFSKDRIFAYLTLTGDERKLYDLLFQEFVSIVRKPDLVVYLQSNVDRLMQNIHKRNRDIEAAMERDYISRLNEAYNEFFFRYDESPLLIVDCSGIDFVNNQQEFDIIYNQIFNPQRAKIEYIKRVKQPTL
jgi:deoxyadenosine/deoxycytidine kinase